MSRVFRMRDWVSLEEAAKHLSTVFQEEVSDIDILGLGLGDKIRLSVRIDAPTLMRLCKFITLSEATDDPAPYENAQALVSSGDVFSVGDTAESIVWVVERHQVEPVFSDGLFDLLMRGDAESVKVEMQRRRGRTVAPANALCAAYLKEPDVFDDHGGLRHKGRPFKLLERGDDGVVGAFGLPAGSEIVLRPIAVAEFIEAQTVKKKDADVGTKERNNLCAIIGVLCAELHLDLSLPSHASGVAKKVVKMAEDLGVSISESTIESHLRRVPDAIAQKKK
jgi:hypothetical protein